MTDHNARQAGLTAEREALQYVVDCWEAAEIEGLPSALADARYGGAGEVASQLADLIERRISYGIERARAILAAHSADARNGDGVALTDEIAKEIWAEICELPDRYWSEFEKEACISNFGEFLGCVERVMERRALLAAPAAPAPKCTRCEYIGKCDCEVAAAPAAQAAQGWKLVPVEPTDEMVVAFAEAWFSKVRPIDDCMMNDAYAAMLDAAPAAPDTEPAKSTPPECTCPSGNGSLRHPCPVHPIGAANQPGEVGAGVQEPRCAVCGAKTTDPWLDHRGCQQLASAQQDEREESPKALKDASEWLLDVMGDWDFTIPNGAFDKIVAYIADQQVQADAGAVAAFERWLCSEMPAGTVIGDPKWWAPRILRAALSREQPQPSNAAACTNSDVWNCKYCDKTTTCEALAAQSGTTSTAVLGDLSPCPFCGGMASSPEVEQIEHAGWVGRIACDHCDAVVSLQYSSTSPGIAGNAVIAAWNCRASEQPQPSNGDREGGAV